jgi:hypothetical protein
MKRDMELIRAILMGVEEFDDLPSADDLGVSDDIRDGHLLLLTKALLVEGIAVVPTDMGTLVQYTLSKPRLTWDGHEFLDAARDPTTWESAKKTLNDAGKDLGNVTIAVLQALLIDTTKRAIGLP